ncbi:hypothetical protein C8R47DRAFT_93936 [Mycena vitilis]|nr:hypothetical protein C8R47DRAFT_93936 [Mycena vitilis]
MHDCLRPQNILRLPVSLRRVATAAADGSVDDLRALCYEMEHISTSRSFLFLPAFYANLDPAGIPNIDDAHERAEDIGRGRASLEGIYASQFFIPAHAFLDIWPRYWSWFQFFQIDAQMNQDPEAEEHSLCQKLIVLVARFSRTPAVAQLVAESPGVRSAFARAWWLLARTESSTARDAGFDCLIGCISGPANATEPAGLEEYVDGAGGDIFDLASLIVQTISEIVPDRSTTPSALAVKTLRGVLNFVIATDHIHDKDWGADTRALSIALREIGFVRALTTVIYNLADATVRDGNHAIHDSFTLLGFSFNAYLGHLYISEAIQHGLLQAMLTCGNQPANSTVHGHLKFLLEAILPMSLMYHSVIRDVEDALSAIKDGAALADTEMWQKFMNLARERVAVLKSVDATDPVWPTACDNIECGLIDARPKFKRCSGCKSAYYCSEQCQILDWRHGGHHRICAPGLLLPLTEYQGLSRRDRVFIRTVLHHDYEALKADTVYPAQAMFMNQFPRDGFMTLFDYTWGRPNVKVLSVVKSHESKQFRAHLGAEWVTAVSRALRSEGRIELHLVRLVVSAVPKFWLVPMRTNTTSLHARIKQLATSFPPDINQAEVSPGLLDQVHLLIDEEDKAGFQSIH